MNGEEMLILRRNRTSSLLMNKVFIAFTCRRAFVSAIDPK